MLSENQIATIVQDFYNGILEQENGLRLRLGRIPDDVRAKRAEHFKEVATLARSALGANEFETVAFITEAMIRKHDLSGALNDLERKKLSQALIRGGVDLAEAVRARYEGDFNFEPRDKLLLKKIDAVFEPSAKSIEPISSEPKARKREGHLPFSKEAAVFAEKQRALGRWENQTALQSEKSYRLFASICGDRPLGDYTRRDAGNFKDQLERLPADYGKAARYIGKTPAAILKIEAEAGTVAARLSVGTVKRHISALSSLWDEGISRGAATEKIFSGFKFPSQQRAQDQRPMWRRSDLVELFKTPVWSGCKSEGRRTVPGNLVVRDEKFWIPLIAVFSGARQEEICQLQVDDVKEEAGIWYFDINKKPPKKLKNRSAVRLIPIHSELIKLGFLDVVTKQRNDGHERVFSNLHPGGADGRLGHAFTKWFTRYRKDVKLYGDGRDFHSLRHSATTFLHQGGVTDAIVDRLTGHTTPGESARYTKETSLSQLKKVIDTISIEVDFSDLYQI